MKPGRKVGTETRRAPSCPAHWRDWEQDAAQPTHQTIERGANSLQRAAVTDPTRPHCHVRLSTDKDVKTDSRDLDRCWRDWGCGTMRGQSRRVLSLRRLGARLQREFC